MTVGRVLARVWLVGLACGALGAPMLTPYQPQHQFRAHVLTPPMSPHLRGADGRWTWPFVYRSEGRQVARAAGNRPAASPTPVRLHFSSGGVLLHVAEPMAEPWFPLGTDHLGRDIWTRIVYGARLSLGLAVGAGAVAVLLGWVIGAAAAFLGGLVRQSLETLGAFTTAVPLLYLVIFLRAMLPLSLGVSTIFLVLVTLFTLAAWPPVASGVRSIVSVELSKDYVAALRAGGASRLRVLWRVLPTTLPFVTTQLLLLTPAFMVAESTLSFVGWGFPSDVPSWGTLLEEASNLNALVEYPWLLSAAVAIASVSLALQAVRSRPRGWGRARNVGLP